MINEYVFRNRKISDFFTLLSLSYVALAFSYSLPLFLILFLAVPLNLIISLLLHKYVVCEYIPTKKVVGYVSFNRYPFSKKAILVYFVVNKNHRRKHIGKTLLTNALKAIKEKGFNEVVIAIRYENAPMRSLLESSGFRLKRGNVVYEHY